MEHNELGIYGERMAENFLMAKGYSIEKRNYRFRHLELDLICMDQNQLVIVEVKTRQTAEIGAPYKAVTRTKQKQIIKASHQFITENNLNIDTRFDVVSIVHNSYRTEIEHIENAFTTVG